MQQITKFECIPVEFVVRFIRYVCSKSCKRQWQPFSMIFPNRCYFCTSLRAEVSLLHALLLAFTESFASLLVSVSVFFLTTRLTCTSDANYFVNTKSHAREKQLLTGYLPYSFHLRILGAQGLTVRNMHFLHISTDFLGFTTLPVGDRL